MSGDDQLRVCYRWDVSMENLSPDRMIEMMADDLFAHLIDAGMRLAGQVDTFVTTFHVKEHHPGPLSECGVGTCRSSLKHLLAWEMAAGDEGHNWIAEQGRRG